MTSALHEAVVELFRARPSLAHELLADRLGEVVVGPVRMADSALTDVVPAAYAADLVITIGHPRPKLAIAVEVQREDRKREEKTYSWPVYAWTLRARHRCPSVVLVWAPTRAIAKWARTPITNGPMASFVPLVIGPDDVPRLVDPERVRTEPELAVLSALAHGSGPGGRQVLKDFVAGIKTLPGDGGKYYHDLVTGLARPAAKRFLEELMYKKGQEPFSDWAKGHYRQGKAEGKAEGIAEGEARIVLRLLARQVGMMGPDRQAQIEAMPPADLESLGEALLGFTDIADLDAWLDARQS